MPRTTQSRESGIVNYFKTAELAIALVVLGLAKDAVAERQTRSKEAKARAQATAAPAPRAVAPPVRSADGVSRPAKTKKRKARKARKARKPATPAAQIEGPAVGAVYDESDLNG